MPLIHRSEVVAGTSVAVALRGTFEVSLPAVWIKGWRPKSSGVYLVTRDLGSGIWRVDVLFFFGNRWTRTKHWDDRAHIKGVVAWMPLPEPFVVEDAEMEVAAGSDSSRRVPMTKENVEKIKAMCCTTEYGKSLREFCEGSNF